MSRVRPGWMVNPIPPLESLRAECSISAPASMSASGAGLPFEARLVISTQVLQPTILRPFQAGSTTWQSAADSSCAGTEWELNADQKAGRSSLFSGDAKEGIPQSPEFPRIRGLGVGWRRSVQDLLWF